MFTSSAFFVAKEVSFCECAKLKSADLIYNQASHIEITVDLWYNMYIK